MDVKERLFVKDPPWMQTKPPNCSPFTKRKHDRNRIEFRGLQCFTQHSQASYFAFAVYVFIYSYWIQCLFINGVTRLEAAALCLTHVHCRHEQCRLPTRLCCCISSVERYKACGMKPSFLSTSVPIHLCSEIPQGYQPEFRVMMPFVPTECLLLINNVTSFLRITVSERWCLWNALTRWQ